jgi:hypothetical protein
MPIATPMPAQHREMLSKLRALMAADPNPEFVTELKAFVATLVVKTSEHPIAATRRQCVRILLPLGEEDCAHVLGHLTRVFLRPEGVQEVDAEEQARLAAEAGVLR